MDSYSFVLADINDLSSISDPLKSTQRIKYTCFNVSQSLLLFGASSGSVYVFRRDTCSFLQLIPSQEGSVANIAVSPDEKLVAFASVKGVVCVLEKGATGLVARPIFVSTEHYGVCISALQWNGHSNELFIGDKSGRVSVISFLPFMVKNMFNPPSCILMQLDSEIVQIDWHSDFLLISTFTRSYICDIVKERFRQIGVKLRDGEYGACFYTIEEFSVKTSVRTESVAGPFLLISDGEKLRDGDELKNIKVFCARPGSRLWEVLLDGTVLNTHQFKQALAIPPTSIIKIRGLSDTSHFNYNEAIKCTNIAESEVIWNQQSFNFCKLFVLSERYLFTFKKDGIYIFDPEKSSVVMWSNYILDIVDAQVLKDMIYVWTASGQMYTLLFSPLEKFLVKLYLRKQYKLCAHLCEEHSKYLMQEAPTSPMLYLLADLGTKLSNDEVADRILPLLQQLSKCAQENRNVQKLESGIFILENHHFLSQENSDMSLPNLKKADRLKDKSRSLSLSPEQSRRNKKDSPKEVLCIQRPESSFSLPELRDSSKKTSDISNEQQPENNNIPRQSSSAGISFSKDLFSSFDTSPETIQTLKDFGQTVTSKITSSTKSLMEKLQVLEGRILKSDMPQELKTNKMNDCNDNAPVKKSESPDMQLPVDFENSEIDVTDEKKKKIPDIDVNSFILILKDVQDCEDRDNNQLTLKLLENLIYLYNDYISAIKEIESGNINDTKAIKSLHENANMTWFLVDWCGYSFPFENYFLESTIKVLSAIIHESFQTGALISWLNRIVHHVQCSLYENPLQELYPIEVIRTDILLSRFLMVCSDLLDPRTILEMVKSSGLLCYYMTFCTILDKYEAGALQQVHQERPIESSCWQWPLPLKLTAMSYMLGMNRVETCYMMGDDVDMKDICYLVIRSQEGKFQSGDESAFHKSYFMFLSYIDQSNNINSVMEYIISDEPLMLFTLKAFQFLNKSPGESCSCGFPFPANKVEQIKFQEVGNILANYLCQSNHDRHIEMCKMVPNQWKEYLRNYFKEKDDIEPVLPLLLQLCELQHFETCLKNMTSFVWKKVLDMIKKIHSGHCLQCGLETIPEDRRKILDLSVIGSYIIKCLGPQEALDILMNHSVTLGSGELDSRFYSACIFSAIVGAHADGLCSNVVDLVLANHETESNKTIFSNEVSKQIEESLTVDLGKTSMSLTSNEHTDHHWGIRLNLQEEICRCCALPLGSPLLMGESGLTVFQCGHAFHTVCFRQRQKFGCLVCHQYS